MWEYIVCSIFWLVFTAALHGLGRAVCTEKKSTSYNFAVGYLLYSLAVAAGGILIQLLNLPWKVFAFFMFFVWIAVMILLILRRNVFRTDSWKMSLYAYLRDNWVLLMVCLFLCGMLFFYYNAFWYGNHLDDGYYITKIATMPYNTSGFRTNYSVGVSQSGIDSYVFNTWELEASFYVKMLGVKSTLFLRLFQSAFYYFLFLNCLKLLAEQIFAKTAGKLKSKDAQYVTIVTLVFGAFYVFLMITNFFFVRDMFQFNSAMFYGASLVKTLSMVLMLVFFIDIRKIDMRMFFSIICIAIVLISKSSIALPVIGITTFAYLTVSLFFCYDKFRRKISVLLVLAYIAFGIAIPGNSLSQTEVYQYVVTALKSPVVIMCTVVFIWSFFLKEKVITRLNTLLLICMAAMVIPQVNDIFETLSIYRFVAGRAWTTWVYTYVMVNTVYFYLIFYRLMKNKRLIRGVCLAIGLALVAADAIGFDTYGGELFITEEPVEANIKYNLKTIVENPYFVPASTIQLGAALEEIALNNNDELRVVMPEGVSMNGTIHNLSVQIRIFAPNIVVPSAINRYPVSKESELYGYMQQYYDEFVLEPSDVTSASLKQELNKYNIDCVVVIDENSSRYLENMGYHLYKTIEDVYYVWCR